jgi:class 3 adenylate cyclase
MPQGGVQRHLATVLFLDIVGSTRIASEIGDRRWRELLSRFRHVVHAQLRKHGGREENFTGDGFLATFTDPERAIRAGVDIAAGVHDLGVDVRCGLHTGECERIEGSLGGIAVHIASRVMSHAADAQVLATSTVEELVIGASIEFEDHALHELKGVPGPWELYPVRSVDGEPAPRPLEEVVAADRIASVQPPPLLHRRRKLVIGGAAVLTLAAAGAAFAVLAGGGEPSGPGPGSREVTLMKVNPQTNEVVKVLRDGYRSEGVPGSLWSIGGALWQATPDELVRRDIETGEPQATIPLGAPVDAVGFGYGSAWIAEPTGSAGSVIRRHDAVTGRPQHELGVGTRVVSLSAGNDAMWALGADGSLLEIDAVRTRVSHTFYTGSTSPALAVAESGYVWISDPGSGRVIQFDPRAAGVAHTVPLPSRGSLVAVDTDGVQTLWILDPSRGTLTPIDAVSGRTGRTVAFEGSLGAARIGFDSLWVAGRGDVERIPLAVSDANHAIIQMPRGAIAGSIAIDEQTGAVWVADCACKPAG